MYRKEFSTAGLALAATVFGLCTWSCSDEASRKPVNIEARLPHLGIPQHPFLAPNGVSNMHNDAYMTDTYEYSGPSGNGASVTLESYSNGMNTCVTMTFDSKGRIYTVSATLLNYRLLLLEPGTLKVIASYDLPPRDAADPLFPYNDTSGAAYFVMDKEERVILADSENHLRIVRYDDESGEFSTDQDYDLSAYVVPMEPPARDHVQMAIPDWSGRYLWFTTRYGKVGAVDTSTGEVHAIELKGEEIQNSFAVAEDGAYIVSDHAMYKIGAGSSGVPIILWRTAYDRGDRVKPSNFNQGSGSTPQVFGEMVAITDNAEPRMNVLFLRRFDGSVACKLPVFDEGESTTENAMPGWVRIGPRGLEYSVIIDNNYGIERDNVLEQGRCWKNHAGGLARVDMVPDSKGGYRCAQVWRSPEKSSQVLPKVSLDSGTLYVYTYEYMDDIQDYQFFFTAVDAVTGETMFRVPTGKGLEYANFGPPMAIGPDGTAYLGTMKGLLMVHD